MKNITTNENFDFKTLPVGIHYDSQAYTISKTYSLKGKGVSKILCKIFLERRGIEISAVDLINLLKDEGIDISEKEKTSTREWEIDILKDYMNNFKRSSLSFVFNEIEVTKGSILSYKLRK